MSRQIPRRLSEMEREMTFDHYKHVYNWNGIDPIVLARRYGVSVREIEATMRQIERINPKPKVNP